MRHILPAYFLIFLIFTSCATPSVREAREVLAECDSLRAAGQLYADSARLADIVTSLNPIRFFYPDDYAKANYYYGRLLRNRDNYVAAMQCFIDASHSRTDDYNLLGRVYSNIGTMCHLVGEFELSYDMYKESAKQFKAGNNLMLYYYDLNNMAFELAEQCKKEETLLLLDSIENDCNDSSIIAKVIETKAQLYLRIEQYDSTLFYTDFLLQNYDSLDPNFIMLKAQALYALEQKDSAVHYAKLLLDSKDRINDRFNALYILLHSDTTLNTSEIIDLSSEREDIRHDEYDPRQQQLKFAVILLQNELINYSKHHIKIVIVCLIILILISIASYITFHIYISRKKTMEEIEYEQHKHQQLKYEEELLELNKSQMEDITNSLKQKYDKLSTEYTQYKQKMKQQIEENAKILKSSRDLKRQLNWSEYDAMCIIINKNFLMLADKLQSLNILNQKEIRLCILVLIGFNRIQIAELLPYSKSGVGKLKDTIAKKLGTSGQNLKNYLIDTAIGQ